MDDYFILNESYCPIERRYLNNPEPPLEQNYITIPSLRTELFDAKTQKERLYWLFNYARNEGLFSNMDDEERDKYRALCERCMVE